MTAATLIAGAAAVVFDLDGTLADTAADLWLALNEALALAGLPPVGKDVVLRSLHGGLEATVDAALEALGQSSVRSASLAASYHACYHARGHAASTAFAGAGPLLQALARAGVAMAVCTNKTEAEARHLLRRVGLAEHIACVTGADTTGHRKPHPAPLLHALQRLGAHADAAVLVGDSRVDQECARAAGVRFILHAGGYDAADVPRRGTCASFHSYAELQFGVGSKRSFNGEGGCGPTPGAGGL